MIARRPTWTASTVEGLYKSSVATCNKLSLIYTLLNFGGEVSSNCSNYYICRLSIRPSTSAVLRQTQWEVPSVQDRSNILVAVVILVYRRSELETLLPMIKVEMFSEVESAVLRNKACASKMRFFLTTSDSYQWRALV